MMPNSTMIMRKAPSAAPAIKDTLEDMVRAMFFEMKQNGFIDLKTGDIESRIEPDLLRQVMYAIKMPDFDR